MGAVNPILNVYSYVMATWAEWQLVTVFPITASWCIWKHYGSRSGLMSTKDTNLFLMPQKSEVAAERYFLYFSVW